jgi:signal transduction histidine kinase
MIAVSPGQLALLTAGISLGYVIFGWFVARRYDGIGVVSLATFAILWGVNFFVASMEIYAITATGVTSGTQLDGLSLVTSLQVFLVGTASLSGLLSVGGIFAWVWFVLRYTRRVGRNEKVGLGILGGAIVGVATLNGLVGALSAFGYVSIPALLEADFHIFASIVEVLVAGVAVGVGIALLYATAREHSPFTTGAVVGLSVPIVFLYLIRYVYQFGLVPGFGAIGGFRAGGLLVGLAGLWVAVAKCDLFEQLPASRTVGRKTAFDATDTAIVVTNNQGDVSDLNPAARELFDAPSTDVIGSALQELLPGTADIEDFRQPRSVTFGFPNSDTVVEAETTRTTDDEGRSIGHTIVFNEITEERRRQQRIQVLNRVLRHNLRNDINAAMGYVEILTDGGETTDQIEVRVKRILDDLVGIGDMARDIEQVLATDPLSDTAEPLSAIVEDAVESADTEDADTPVTMDAPQETTVRINPIVLKSVLAELIENAIEHGDTSTVDVSYDVDPPALIVADDGAGIPAQETEVLDSAKETPLEHGSGLGLWLVKWGTEMFGGTVEFDTDGEGTRVSIEFPPDLVETDGTLVGQPDDHGASPTGDARPGEGA